MDFSGLTNDSSELLQLSLEDTLTEVASVFGYTQEEILSIFSDNIHSIGLQWSKKGDNQITDLEVMSRIATYYNGYRFHKDGVSVYNPWSTLKFLNTGELENY